jgi:arylsulfatase A-like enzyme
MMEKSVAQKKSFFIQLWFHAPHGPWEELPGFGHLYPDLSKKNISDLQACEMNHAANHCRSQSGEKVFRKRPIMNKYKTMVSAMDRSIGNILKRLD